MKKGFTLIEMMAIITILGVLSLIAIVTIDSVIKENKNSAYTTQINNIENQTRVWIGKNIFNMPENDGEFIIITLKDLKDAGLIKSDITNPKTNQQFSNDMQIKITVNHNDYIIEIIE